MQACGTRAPFRSAFAGKAFSAKTTLNKSTGYARRNSFKIQAKIDTGYKKTAGADGKMSTVEDQLHEAEADKNAQSFVKEFKEDLGATGNKKSEQDKQDLQERQDDKIGLKRTEKEAKSQQQQK